MATDEANYHPATSPRYKQLGSPRFNFWLDIPVDWRAFDRSATGDGYFLEVGNASVDARAYGSYMDDPGRHPERKRFVFADGSQGWRETTPDHTSYIRPEGDRFLYFYVQAPAAWMKQNADAIAHVAASLRPGRRE